MLMSYSDINLGQQRRNQAITWTDVDFSLVKFCGIHLRPISKRVPKLLFYFHITDLKMIRLKVLPHIPEDNELINRIYLHAFRLRLGQCEKQNKTKTKQKKNVCNVFSWAETIHRFSFTVYGENIDCFTTAPHWVRCRWSMVISSMEVAFFSTISNAASGESFIQTFPYKMNFEQPFHRIMTYLRQQRKRRQIFHKDRYLSILGPVCQQNRPYSWS